MSKVDTSIRTRARLHRPADVPKGATWSFLVLPRAASAKLPSRGQFTVEGRFNGQAFRATLEPDGEGSHWLKVPERLRKAADAAVGDMVSLEIAPARQQAVPRLPADLRAALDADPEAKALWAGLTPVARRDWIQWIGSAKRAETRARRIAGACDMLVKGKRRVCCFDRSGIYGGGMSAPRAAE